MSEPETNPYQPPSASAGEAEGIRTPLHGWKDPRWFGFIALAAITLQILINAVQLTVPLDARTTAAVNGTHMAAWFVAAVFFLLWIRRCVTNVLRINPHAGISPGWAVGCYFVPFVNWVAPCVTMNHIIRESFRRDPPVWMKILTVAWWVGYLIRSVLVRFMQDSTEFTVVWGVASVISWIGAIILVLKIGSRQASFRWADDPMLQRPLMVALSSRSGVPMRRAPLPPSKSAGVADSGQP